MDGLGSSELRGPVVRGEAILRLVWSPDDIDPSSGELMTSAFSGRDLDGLHNGLSVDRRGLSTRTFNEALADRQALVKAGDPNSRNAAYISESHADRIVSLRDDAADGLRSLFDLIATPQPATGHLPENVAHAEIINVSGVKSPSFKNKLRAKLQPEFTKPTPIADYVWPAATARSNLVAGGLKRLLTTLLGIVKVFR